MSDYTVVSTIFDSTMVEMVVKIQGKFTTYDCVLCEMKTCFMREQWFVGKDLFKLLFDVSKGIKHFGVHGWGL